MSDMDIDFGLATALLYDKLSISFWNTLSFEEWTNVYCWAKTKSKLKIAALEKMKVLDAQFEQWRTIYYHEQEGSPLEKVALQKMCETAQSIGEWLTVYEEVVGSGNEIELIAFDKLRQFAQI